MTETVLLWPRLAKTELLSIKKIKLLFGPTHPREGFDLYEGILPVLQVHEHHDGFYWLLKYF